MLAKIKTFDPRKRKEVVAGYVDGDTFTKKINDNHYFRSLQGYGISQDVFYRLYRLGVKRLILDHPDAIYEASLEDWSINGVLKDVGSGEQRFLNLEYFKRRDK